MIDIETNKILRVFKSGSHAGTVMGCSQSGTFVNSVYFVGNNCFCLQQEYPNVFEGTDQTTRVTNGPTTREPISIV